MLMKYAYAPIVVGLASFTIFAQDPGEPPIKITPPAIEELGPRPDSPPKRTPPAEDTRSKVVPARPRLQPKPIEEHEIEIEAPPMRGRPTREELDLSTIEATLPPTRTPAKIRTRVEPDLSDLAPARAEQLPKNLDVPKVETPPLLPGPSFLEKPPISPAPSEVSIEKLPPPNYRPLYRDLQTIDYTIPAVSSLFGPSNPLSGNEDKEEMFQYRVGPDSAVQLDGAFRGYFRDDQRIKWSGLESTFGAEGVLRPAFVSRTENWVVSSQGEFFLSQRYGSSILSDDARDLYDTNFDVEMFQIFQLFVEARYNDLSVRLGRSRTPFGRYQSPMYTNAMLDAPFIRTEVIGFAETGLFFRYAPSPFVVDLAVVNGEPNLDTNSSKAVVTRWGIENPTWTAGISAKVQDGISSEFQKRYNNVLGVDGSVSLGRFLVYGEAVMDQYGFLRDAVKNPAYDPYQLGVRSLYGRDVYRGSDKSINGKGAYLGVSYRADNWLVDLNCGRYVSEKIGNAVHDKPTNRVLLKTSYMATRNLELYLILLAENKRNTEGTLTNARPFAGWFGMQYGF